LGETRWTIGLDPADEALRVATGKSSKCGYTGFQRSRVLAFGTDLSGAWIPRRKRDEWGVTTEWGVYRICAL